jgi:hypothetical protein
MRHAVLHCQDFHRERLDERFVDASEFAEKRGPALNKRSQSFQDKFRLNGIPSSYWARLTPEIFYLYQIFIRKSASLEKCDRRMKLIF